MQDLVDSKSDSGFDICLRTCKWWSELTLHTVILVNMGEINGLDRKFSSLAPGVRALEFDKVFISNGCLALHCELKLLTLVLF